MTVATETKSVLQNALQAFIESAECRRVIDEIQRGARVISISGMVAAQARALAAAALQRETGKQFAVVVPAQRDLESWERDISFWYCALHGITECEDAQYQKLMSRSQLSRSRSAGTTMANCLPVSR